MKDEIRESKKWDLQTLVIFISVSQSSQWVSKQALVEGGREREQEGADYNSTASTLLFPDMGEWAPPQT